ncbi:MAG TPA: hemerythrin domain-containing protein [Candidatus Omnitrophota bacterium]|jgi:hemerythrin-like domain-containing protein|nr:hemerythrin domain-containing protein [Candidatus Omnitrophota bacterium]
MDATQDLVNEHKAVLVALRLLEKIEGALADRDRQAPEHLDQLLGFFRGFVDRCHHAKEEEVLFPEMERLGLEGEGPIGVMLEEHEAGRRCVRGMAEGLARLQQGDAGALPGIRQNADAYRDLLRRHIEKEEQVLFPMAERMVPAKQAADLISRFDAIERERVGVGKHEEYHAMLDRLRSIYGA